MILHLRNKLKRLPRLRFGAVVTLSLALLSLPCGPIAEAFESHADYAVSGAEHPKSGRSQADGIQNKADHDDNCCINSSHWLAGRFDDGLVATVIHDWSRSDLCPAWLAHTPSHADRSVREGRVTAPPLVVLIDDTSLYAKTQRYRL